MMRRNNLPEDMEMDILLRLPVKSLLRFKCVSKSWCARFQNQLFITNHYLKQTNKINNNDYANVSLLITRLERHIAPKPDLWYFSLLDQNLRFKENIYFPMRKRNSTHFMIMGPCNGLMCLWYGDANDQVILWNPATREFKQLPQSHIQRPPNTVYAFFQGCGFGFDSKTDNYKVIGIFDCYSDDGIIGRQVDLYSLSTDSWREIRQLEYYDTSTDTWRDELQFLVFNIPKFDTYINGVFHWHSVSTVLECIIAFDLADEFFKILPLPFNSSSRYDFWDVGVLNGSLAIINYPNWGMEKSFDIWVMKEYGVTESWTKQLTIGPIFEVYCPVGFWKNCSLFLGNFDRQLVLYDPNIQEIEKFQLYSHNLSWRPVNYVESLVPINGRQEHEDEHFVRVPTQMRDV